MMQFQISICKEWKEILDHIKADILFYFGKNEYSIEEITQDDRCLILFRFYDPRDYTTDISTILYRALSQSVGEKYKAYYIQKAKNNIPAKEQDDFIQRANRVRVILDSTESIEVLKCMLHKGDIIALDGFFRFVMRPFRNELKHRIDLIVEDILVACEYMEFIDLMREFTQDQPHTGQVHLVTDEQAGLALMDEKMDPIPQTTDPVFDDVMKTQDDCLLSTLLTLSPDRITLHTQTDSAEESPILNTIKQIFTNKFDFSKK